MNNREDNLKWNRRTPGSYWAESGDWKYTVDQPRTGDWCLRGWGPEDQAIYQPNYGTLREAKVAAAEHLASVTPPPVVRFSLPDMAPVALAALEALQGLTRAMRINLQLGCGCPTPTHRMHCGRDARPRVVVETCPTCLGSGVDPEDLGDWVPEAGAYNPYSAVTCPACVDWI
jgi:hypothetical protein